MNSNSSCHEISDCPGLFVDAFRTSKHLQKSDVCLILSHYHADHYGNLPRGYQGPSKIHCTPITARLLREIHEVNSQFVVEHEYGDVWEYVNSKKQRSRITFLDAHHCPGAAIVLIDLPDVDKLHLHTGDMRYHDKMLQYPQLIKAAKERRLDTVWLDTTYALATRRFSFPSQEQAISETVKQVQSVLQEDLEGDTLVLLCCYNIGKEKIMWRLANESSSNEKKMRLYANERKMRMLELVDGLSTRDNDSSNSFTKQFCTSNPKETNIHIVPMNLPGKMWPFFQPNYQACAKYALENIRSSSEQSESCPCSYKRVIVFCPTGWAAANNWNRKNNIHVCSKTKVPNSREIIHVEIRLLPYSEHSSLSELQTLVNDHWKPRRIVPTVYRTEAERLQILKLFTVDHNRAKEHFFQSMKAKAKPMAATEPMKTRVASGSESSSKNSPVILLAEDECDANATENELDNEISPHLPIPVTHSGSSSDVDGNLSQLVDMGFSRSSVELALLEAKKASASGNVVNAALNLLLSSEADGTETIGKNMLTISKAESPLPTKKKRRTTQQTSLDRFVVTSPPSKR
mmetsp:Transcript_8348/g.17914  ORF Transcript_8348/g.17914 Transcript_8348/m.17914 type:complete len:574 (-) Transcript_8348:3077-4798(-)